MDIPYKTRHLYPDELRLLETLNTRENKVRYNKIKFYHLAIAGLLGIASTYLASIIKVGFFAFLFGLIALFAYGFVVFTPYEIYKARRKQRAFLNELSKFIEKKTVDTYTVAAKRIAVAKEYDDEGDLFIVEYDTDMVLYLWDYDYNLRKKFPCLAFEIYEDRFFKLFGRQIFPLSGRITPLTIDKKTKWNYMEKVGVPGHLQIQHINFDTLIADINNCSPEKAI